MNVVRLMAKKNLRAAARRWPAAPQDGLGMIRRIIYVPFSMSNAIESTDLPGAHNLSSSACGFPFGKYCGQDLD
jgi:hypothetical protein